MKDMMKNNYITIGIPFFNAEEYLEDAIRSVFLQTHTHWELILIDDGSTDKSLEIANSIDDPRVRVISDGQNKKLAFRLNQIVQEAKYDLIARMDADDLIPSYRLERQVQYLHKNTDKDFVSTGVCSINNSGEIAGYRFVEQSSDIDAEKLFSNQHNIVHASILVKKTWYERNPYDETMSRAQDFELWLRAFSKNDLKVGIIPDIGYFYREELNLTKEKLVKAYDISETLLKEYKGILNNYWRKKLKIKMKKIIVNVLSSLGLLTLLLNRRYKGESNMETLKSLNKELNLIKNVILPRK
jgi:glycosyltransferase involved in cell wall biosynthesis